MSAPATYTLYQYPETLAVVRLGVGGLTVGPQSAGADPGPAVYGRGGTEPTIADANALLGYLDPERVLGGAIRLDLAAAEEAYAPIADALGREVHVVAERDTSAVGAAVLARAAIEAADLAAIVARSVGIERVHRPEPAHRVAMDAAWRRFCRHAGGAVE